MITSHDIGNLFQAMRTAYGPQWKHGADALPIWRDALKGFTPEDLHQAANKVLRIHVDHPPTLPQFLQIIDPPKRPSTYIEAPKRSRAEMMANRVLIRELMRSRGADAHQRKLMVELKNALVEDCRDEYPSRAWIQDVADQLHELAQGSEPARRALEAENARRAYCRRQGMRYIAPEGQQ